MKQARVVVVLAVMAAAVRLIPLQFLHPLNWDEIEFFRAMTWIGGGRVPFRDFWEHHTPLAWFVFAPVAAMTKSPGVDAVIMLRWAQIPVWIATLWLANLWMRGAGLSRFARWSAMALALASSLFMLPAIEFRVDALACLLYMSGLVLAQRNAPFAAGVAFCLTGLTNLRLGPLLALTVLVLRIVDTREGAWKGDPRMNRVFLGVAATFALGSLYFVGTGSLDELYQQVWYENYLGDKYSTAPGPMFLHRLCVPFGVRLLGSERLFDLALVDPGGMAILVLGFAGLMFAVLSWRTPTHLVVIAFLSATSVFFIAMMKFVYVYHFEIVVVMALPLMAAVIDRIRWRSVVLAVVVLAWSVNLYASLLRGKEEDLAFQDLIMREIDRRSGPSEKVFSGGPWPLRREPAYRFWFLPELARHLVRYGHAERYPLGQLVHDPPAVIVCDHYTSLWIATVQPEIGLYVVRHFMPVWRNLWIPALNVPLPSKARFEWIVPRDGVYRLFASEAIAKHPWFFHPLAVGAYERPDGHRLPLRLPEAAAHPDLEWWIDRRPVNVGAWVHLRKGQRIAVGNRSDATLGIILLPGEDRVIFRQPPPGVTLEAATTRITHIPNLGVRFEP